MARSHFKDYNKDLDQDLFSGMLSLYEQSVPKSQLWACLEQMS